MAIKSLFSIEEDHLYVEGIERLIQLTRFRAQGADTQFLDGLVLADDLKSDTGTIYYTKGTEIDRQRVNRLLALRESNSSLDYHFKIERSQALIARLRRELSDKFIDLLRKRKEIKVYKDFILGVERKYRELEEKLFENESMVLELYRIKANAEAGDNKRSFWFIDHAFNVALFALSISMNRRLEKIVGKKDERFIEILKVAFFHNFGGIKNLDTILELPEGERSKPYWESIHKGIQELDFLKISTESQQAIVQMAGYHLGQRAFLTVETWAAYMTDILVVAEMFLNRERGIFGESQPVRQVVDKMNIIAMERNLRTSVVQALTLGLNLTDIFDFYQELERLLKECPYNGAAPYPLVGLWSPTIFICAKTIRKCPHIELSVRAVNLIKKLGEVPAGDYHRCKLLTPKLMHFYDEHYDEIKDSVAGGKKQEEKDKAKAKAGDQKAAGKPAPAKEGDKAEPKDEGGAEKKEAESQESAIDKAAKKKEE